MRHKPETRNPKAEIRDPNRQRSQQDRSPSAQSSFGFRASDFLRISGFGIRISSPPASLRGTSTQSSPPSAALQDVLVPSLPLGFPVWQQPMNSNLLHPLLLSWAVSNSGSDREPSRPAARRNIPRGSKYQNLREPWWPLRAGTARGPVSLMQTWLFCGIDVYKRQYTRGLPRL